MHLANWCVSLSMTAVHIFTAIVFCGNHKLFQALCSIQNVTITHNTIPSGALKSAGRLSPLSTRRSGEGITLASALISRLRCALCGKIYILYLFSFCKEGIQIVPLSFPPLQLHISRLGNTSHTVNFATRPEPSIISPRGAFR